MHRRIGGKLAEGAVFRATVAIQEDVPIAGDGIARILFKAAQSGTLSFQLLRPDFSSAYDSSPVPAVVVAAATEVIVNISIWGEAYLRVIFTPDATDGTITYADVAHIPAKGGRVLLDLGSVTIAAGNTDVTAALAVPPNLIDLMVYAPALLTNVVKVVAGPDAAMAAANLSILNVMGGDLQVVAARGNHVPAAAYKTIGVRSQGAEGVDRVFRVIAQVAQ